MAAHVGTGSWRREFNSNGCFILLTTFNIFFLYGSVYKSYSVLLPVLKEQFATHTWVLGIVIALTAIAAELVGFFSKALEVKFGCRAVSMWCVGMISLGFVLLSFATSAVLLPVAMICFVGPGIGIGAILSRSALARHFREHYTLACGVGHIGRAVSLFVTAPLTQLCLDIYGWRGAALLISGIFMHPMISSAKLRIDKERGEYKPVPDQESTQNTAKGKPSRKLTKIMDLSLLCEFRFWAALMCTMGYRSVGGSWMVYFVPHLQAKGITPKVAASLTSAPSVGFLIGTVFWTPFIARNLVRCSTALIISSLLLALTLIVDPWVNEVASIAVVNLVLGLAMAATCTLVDVFTKDVLGEDRLLSALALTGPIIVPGRILCGFMPGWIYDAYGTYDPAFAILGLLHAAAVLPLIVHKFVREGQ